MSDELELVSIVSQCEHNLLEPPLDATSSFHCHQGPVVPGDIVESLSTSMRAVPISPLVLLSINPVPIRSVKECKLEPVQNGGVSHRCPCPQEVERICTQRKRPVFGCLLPVPQASLPFFFARANVRVVASVFPRVKLQSLHFPQVSGRLRPLSGAGAGARNSTSGVGAAQETAGTGATNTGASTTGAVTGAGSAGRGGSRSISSTVSAQVTRSATGAGAAYTSGAGASVWVEASAWETRRGLKALWCVAVAMAHWTANVSCLQKARNRRSLRRRALDAPPSFDDDDTHKDQQSNTVAREAPNAEHQMDPALTHPASTHTGNPGSARFLGRRPQLSHPSPSCRNNGI